MTSKNFMIFQKAVSKYEGIYEKSKSSYFSCFYPQILMEKFEKFWRKMQKMF